ncbi:hypothetical protein MWF99_09295 [Fusobacterium necrophorum]|uniref:hypothetical protein n=1 Tax=Fusobacterium necrophorum TaxID=859 RepID=UPI0007892BAE|nr:hypothetical protein [Fusobacterium necrophorum]KYM65512.1 hypothetical protein A2U16_03165 [Fusobacterium necrophorum subsp. funduliforme]MBR8722385.1 hypothetical protein [Fusobacterium necrophorum subsp. funduliforme]MDK4523056.1 hypothetical protein [Fusobacterium necrophorum]
MIRKLLTIAVTIFIFIGCESKEEREIQKFLSNIVNTYNEKDYKETFAMIEDFESKYPDSKRIEELKEIKQQSEIEIKKEERELKEKQEKMRKIENKFKEAMQNIEKEYDEFNNITWFESKNIDGEKFSKETEISVTRVFLYGSQYGRLGEYADNVRLVLRYYGDDWIFFDKVIILADGERKEFQLNVYKAKREVVKGGFFGRVYEEYDIAIGEDDMDFFLKVANSNTAKVRFSGKYDRDFYLNSNEKYIIKNILTAYKKNLYLQIVD